MKKKVDKNVSKKIKKGAAVRTRDEFFKDGAAKEEWKNKPMAYYRTAYVVETNNNDEFALVKSTAHKGKQLLSNSNKKFKPTLYVKDALGNFIKINDKFIRSSREDIPDSDVEHIMKKCKKFPDTYEKLSELKKAKKKPKKKK